MFHRNYKILDSNLPQLRGEGVGYSLYHLFNFSFKKGV